MSKKTTASPSASAGGAGAKTDPVADLKTPEVGDGEASVDHGENEGPESGEAVAVAAPTVDAANVQAAAAAEEVDEPAADGEPAVDAPRKVAKGVYAAALKWAAGLSYPVSTFLRNNGHVPVVEPITAQIVGGGAAVQVSLHDESHAVAVLSNTVTLNALHFQGELKVRLDVAPDELYLEV